MFDSAVKNALIVDGTRKQPFVGNVYIKDGRIAEVTTDDRDAAETFDASGLVAAPGFIDIHTHSDASFLITPTHEGKLLGLSLIHI